MFRLDARLQLRRRPCLLVAVGVVVASVVFVSDASARTGVDSQAEKIFFTTAKSDDRSLDVTDERRAAVAPFKLRPPARLEVRLAGVSAISASADAVAIAAELPGKCGTIRLWSPPAQRMSTVRAGCSNAGGYNGVSDLLLRGTVVAWVFSWGDRGQGSDCLLMRRVSAAGIGRRITRHDQACNVEYGGFFGGRSLAAFKSVANGGTTGAEGELLTSLQPASMGIAYTVEGYCNDPSSCPTPAVVPRHVERSFLVSADGKETPLAGRGVRILAAAATVVAASRSNSLDVYDLDTRVWHKITRGLVRAVRIDKDELFVLRPKGLLETYRIRSGIRVAVQQLVWGHTPVQLEDVDDGFVIYTTNHRIHIRR